MLGNSHDNGSYDKDERRETNGNSSTKELHGRPSGQSTKEGRGEEARSQVGGNGRLLSLGHLGDAKVVLEGRSGVGGTKKRAIVSEDEGSRRWL